MSTEAALLAAIAADPDDDTARLVYADWLSENGQDGRAQYVRAAVAFDLQTASKFGPLVGWAQDLFLLSTGHPHSLPHLDPAKAGWAWRYARGFVSDLTLPADALVKHAAAIFAAHPVQLVTLTGKRPIMDNPDHYGPHAKLECSFDYWYRPGAVVGAEEEELPLEIFDHLARLFPERVLDRDDERKVFESPTVYAAEHAVSLAAVAFGRQAAGLPEFLPPFSVERAGK